MSIKIKQLLYFPHSHFPAVSDSTGDAGGRGSDKVVEDSK